MFDHRMGALGIGVAVIMVATAVEADAADTTVTFATTSGTLTITAAASATLSGGSSSPGGVIRGSLGTVTVTDGRGTAAGWTAGVYSTTGFTAAGNPDITTAGITYAPGPVTGTTAPGTPLIVTGATGSPGTGTGDARTVYSYANPTPGGNSVSWNPTLAVAIPSTAKPGAVYTGTISYRVA